MERFFYASTRYSVSDLITFISRTQIEYLRKLSISNLRKYIDSKYEDAIYRLYIEQIPLFQMSGKIPTYSEYRESFNKSHKKVDKREELKLALEEINEVKSLLKAGD